MANATSPVQKALEQLKDIAVTPDQTQLYGEAVKIYNPAFSNEHPAFVAFPQNVEDVKRCLRVANDTGTSVVIKSGGHCFAGYSTTDSNAFVISLKKMNSVTLKNDTVTVQAGANWGDVYSLLDNTGDYVAVGGCVPCVGIGGYILGGGYSMLSRAYGGLGCDKAVSFTLVTASGEQVVVASEDENEDLFWALKGGGGGNFGVLTDVTLNVCPRPKQFIWSRLTYTTENIEKGLNAIGAQLKVLPKDLNLDFIIHHESGVKVLTLDAVYSDRNQDEVESALKSLNPTKISAPKVYTSYLKFTTEYSAVHGYVHNEAQPIYIKGVMIQALPPDLAKFFANLDLPPECILSFVHMGGDIKNFSPTATAFPCRSGEYSFYTYGRFASHDAERKKEVFEFATSTYNAVKKSDSALGSYVNYMDRELKNWTHEFYGVNYSRLCEIKEKWNPLGKGPLHFNQEIGSSWEPPSE